jgi:uncharacterized protein (DUF305 family)
MNTTTKIVLAAVIGILVGAGGVMAFAKPDTQMAANTSGGHTMPDGSTMGGAMNMQASMDGMMASLDGKTGDAFDQAFLTEMTMHHQGAVQMAQLALQNAKHQEIKDMAQNIITAQNAEIKQMQDWKAAWYGQ